MYHLSFTPLINQFFVFIVWTIKEPPYRRHGNLPKDNYLFLFSHCWLATPQLVLQALWHEVWHSPHPPVFALAQRSLVSSVLILFIMNLLQILESSLFTRIVAQYDILDNTQLVLSHIKSFNTSTLLRSYDYNW